MDDRLVKELCSYRSFLNNSQGFRQLVQWAGKLASKGVPILYVMEATGAYHEKLAYYLEQQQCCVSIVLPNKINHYFKTLDVKSITDKTASEAIALFGLERTLDSWHSPHPVHRKLRQLTRERDQLVQERTMIKNQLHAEKVEAFFNDQSMARMKQRIDLLNKQESIILNEIKKLVQNEPALKKQVEIISTIPGVGILTAATVLAETNGFDLIRNKKQLTSYAGLDVKEKQSGTSIKGKPSISKRGNRYLRKALHLPALAAIRHEQQYKNQFVRLVSRHGIKMKAAVAVQRKLLELMYTLFKTDKPFDPNYKAQHSGVEKLGQLE